MVGDGFEILKVFIGELVEVNLWDIVFLDVDIVFQYRNCYILYGFVIQWFQFEVMGEVEIKQYSCMFISGKLNQVFIIQEEFEVLFFEQV